MSVPAVGPGTGHVLVVGPAAWNTLVHLDRLPEPRAQTVFADEWHRGLGGTSAGKARTLAALGVPTVLHTVVGTDDDGERVLRALKHPLLTVHPAASADGRTERHLNLLSASGERVSVYLDLPEPARTGYDRLPDDLAGARAAVLDLAGHTRDVLDRVGASGVPVWCDLHDDDGTADFQRPFAAAADVLLVSDVRLPDPAAYLRRYVEAGCTLAVCTRGARGALALDAGGFWEVPVAAAPAVVDAEGAGDAFLAGLLAATLAGQDTAQALAQASAAGALAVASPGLAASATTPGEVAELARTVLVRRA